MKTNTRNFFILLIGRNRFGQARSINSPLERRLSFAIIALACLAFLPLARAVTPAPDGGYPGQNTAEGTNALFSLTFGAENTGLGFSALYSNTTGLANTAVGSGALYRNTTGGDNTAVGAGTLSSNATGAANTAVGAGALNFNVTGRLNTAVGADALQTNNASDNTGVGYLALNSNTSGTQNTAVGGWALHGNGSIGSYNTAIGFQSLLSVTTGYGNVANGWRALYSNRTGIYNTATGAEALFTNDANANNATDFNTATGGRALYTNLTGRNNTATGYTALYNNTSGSFNTAEGLGALSNNTTGSNNVALGYQAGLNLTTGSNNIVIGAGVLGAAGEANKIRIGKSIHTATYIGGIYNKNVSSATTGGGVPVLVDSTGKLGTLKSSARYKEAIKPMDKASEAILALEPVTFRYKQELDPDGVTQFGLIAEQVEKIDQDLVIRDEDGKVSTVRYEAVNAMLLNEFLKAHRKLQEQGETLQKQQATIAKQEQRIAQQQKDFQTKFAQQQKQIQSLTAGLQKVNSKIELERATQRLSINH